MKFKMKFIKPFLSCLLLVFIATGSIMAEKNNSTVSKNQIVNNKTEPVSKLVNNGKLLSDFGYKNISDSEVTSIIVSKDTIFITITETALKRIDRDSRNYVITSSKVGITKIKNNK